MTTISHQLSPRDPGSRKRRPQNGRRRLKPVKKNQLRNRQRVRHRPMPSNLQMSSNRQIHRSQSPMTSFWRSFMQTWRGWPERFGMTWSAMSSHRNSGYFLKSGSWTSVRKRLQTCSPLRWQLCLLIANRRNTEWASQKPPLHWQTNMQNPIVGLSACAHQNVRGAVEEGKKGMEQSEAFGELMAIEAVYRSKALITEPTLHLIPWPCLHVIPICLPQWSFW